MLYTVFVAMPTKIEVEANSAEEAEKMVRENLIKSGQMKPADWFEIKVAEEVKI